MNATQVNPSKRLPVHRSAIDRFAHFDCFVKMCFFLFSMEVATALTCVELVGSF
jgi:hypothetical protein